MIYWKNYYTISLILLIIFVFLYKQISGPKKFVIVIASYNNSKWYKYNLNSVFSQTYPNYRIIYIDDCSPDHTYNLVKKYVEDKNFFDKIILIQNQKRVGALANHYKAIEMCDNNEIIVCLDGDDWFANDDVLEYLAKVYNDPSIWLTYSQFRNWPSGQLGWSEDIPKEVIEKNEFRKFGFISPQLRTYYAWLAKLVKLEDLKWEKTNDFFPVAGDVALMFPMLEMAGKHFKFIPRVLCQRNVATQINDFKINPDLQILITEHIASKKPYLPL